MSPSSIKLHLCHAALDHTTNAMEVKTNNFEYTYEWSKSFCVDNMYIYIRKYALHDW